MIVEIDVTADEVQAGKLTDENKAAAVKAILDDGVVMLKNVVDTRHLDILHERMVADLEALQARKDAPYNWNAGNIQQDPPPFPPYLFKDVLLNELVIEVTNAVIGPGIKSHMYSGNTALPSDSRQPVHADFTHLWPILEVAHPPVGLIVNVSTVDVSPENASTEIWPGTHKDITIAAGSDIKIPADKLEARRQEVPPIQPVVPRGSVVIRDGRMWHAGMPNRTNTPRPMIAMMHSPRWMDVGTPMTFPVGTEEFFQHPIVQTCARFVEGNIDHIHAPHGYEYEK